MGSDFMRTRQPSRSSRFRAQFRQRLYTCSVRTDPLRGIASVRRPRQPAARTSMSRIGKSSPALPHLAMTGMIETRVERNGSPATERHYYLSSTPLDAKAFAAVARVHWGVENRHPLDARCRFPRRPRPPAKRTQPAEHGGRQTHGHEHRPQPKRSAQPQGPAKARKSQPGLSPSPHPTRLSLTCSDSPALL